MPRTPGGVPERPKGTGCKPVGSAYGGSNPPAPMMMNDHYARGSTFGPPPHAFSRALPPNPPLCYSVEHSGDSRRDP